jgi:hypothetical protein
MRAPASGAHVLVCCVTFGGPPKALSKWGLGAASCITEEVPCWWCCGVSGEKLAVLAVLSTSSLGIWIRQCTQACKRHSFECQQSEIV